MDQKIEMQSRMKSPIFWIGMIACVFEAVINSLVSAGIVLPAWLPAIGPPTATLRLGTL